MTKLHNVPLSAGQFHFSKQSNRLIAEASELAIGVGNHVESIKLRSPHTGRVAFFQYDHEAAIAAEGWDGEMAEYRSKDPFAKHLTLVILNT